MHLQSHADLRTFLTDWRKASTMVSCPFLKLANEEPVVGGHLRYEPLPRVILHVKGGGPEDKERVRPLEGLNAALLGQQPHTQPRPHAAA